MKEYNDWSHVDRMRNLLKQVREVTASKGIPYPFEFLTEDRVKLLEGPYLEEALISVAFPDKEIGMGHGRPGIVEEYEVTRGKEKIKRLVFYDRKAAVMFAMESLERMLIQMGSTIQ